MKFRTVVVLRDFKANGYQGGAGEVVSRPIAQAGYWVHKKWARWATDEEAAQASSKPSNEPSNSLSNTSKQAAPEPEPQPPAIDMTVQSFDEPADESAQPLTLYEVGKHPSLDDDASEPEGLPKAFPSRRGRKKPE